MTIELRPFAEADYGRLADIEAKTWHDHAAPAADWRRRDARFDYSRFFRARYVAELDGQVAGWGQIGHMPQQFYADKYRIDIAVDPATRRRGVGGALYDRLLADALARNAESVRARTNEAMADAVKFVETRGFVERSRSWESRLDVTTFDFGQFAAAEARAQAESVQMYTWAELRDREGDAIWRQVYDFNVEVGMDVPFVDPLTPATFEWFSANILAGPNAIPEGYFVARIGDEIVGVSELRCHKTEPTMLHQNLTGVKRSHRSKGIAMALKLQTVRFARDNGYREIQTWNNVNNQPILRINEAMGFVKQPAWVEYDKLCR